MSVVYRCTVLTRWGTDPATGWWEERCGEELDEAGYARHMRHATGPCNHLLAQYVAEVDDRVECEHCDERFDPFYGRDGLCEMCLEDAECGACGHVGCDGECEEDYDGCGDACDGCHREVDMHDADDVLLWNPTAMSYLCGNCTFDMEDGEREDASCRARFPHTCGCGSPAYRGFNSVECSRPGCGGRP